MIKNFSCLKVRWGGFVEIDNIRCVKSNEEMMFLNCRRYHRLHQTKSKQVI